MEISVIIPIHNAEKYLKQCVDSVLNQEFVDKEILLIDDGSTDKSGKICDEFESSNKDIKVWHIKKQGVGNARNFGIEKSKGKYLVFIDADDFLPNKEVLSKLYSTIENMNSDIVVGNYYRLWDGNLLPATSHDVFNNVNSSTGDFRFQGFFSTGTLAYVWCKMYRKSFLNNHNIYFGNYTYAQDKMFNFICYSSKPKYSFLNERVYVYRKNDSSVSHRYRKDSADCWMNLANDLNGYLNDNKNGKNLDLVYYTIFFAAFFDSKQEYQNSEKNIAAVIRILKKYGSYPLAKVSFRCISKGESLNEISSWMWKIMLWGFSVCMYLRLYALLAIGIKLLIDLKIDEHLSDTGLRTTRRICENE